MYRVSQVGVGKKAMLCFTDESVEPMRDVDAKRDA